MAACREELVLLTFWICWLPETQSQLRQFCSWGRRCLRVPWSPCTLLICCESCPLWASRSVSWALTAVILALMLSTWLPASPRSFCRESSWLWAFLRSPGPQMVWLQEACWMLICALRLAICWGTVQFRLIRLCFSLPAAAILSLRALIWAWRAAICLVQLSICPSMPATLSLTPAMLPWSELMLALSPTMTWLAAAQLWLWELMFLLMASMLLLVRSICFCTEVCLLRAMLSCWVSPRPLDLAALIWALILPSLELRSSSCAPAPDMADWMFLMSTSFWLMEREVFCWVCSTLLRLSVQRSTSSWAFLRLAVDCLMIQRRLAMVCEIWVCWQKRLVMFTSQSDIVLLGPLPFEACSVVIVSTWVLGIALGNWPATMIVEGQDEIFCVVETVETVALFVLYWPTRLLIWVADTSPEETDPVLPFKLRLRELPKLQFTPLRVSIWAPPLTGTLPAFDEEEEEELVEADVELAEEEVVEEEEGTVETVEIEEMRLLTLAREAALVQLAEAWPDRLTLRRTICVSDCPLASEAVILTGNWPWRETGPLYTIWLFLSSNPCGSPWKEQLTAPWACWQESEKKLLRSFITALLERSRRSESPARIMTAKIKTFISSIIIDCWGQPTDEFNIQNSKITPKPQTQFLCLRAPLPRSQAYGSILFSISLPHYLYQHIFTEPNTRTLTISPRYTWNKLHPTLTSSSRRAFFFR